MAKVPVKKSTFNWLSVPTIFQFGSNDNNDSNK